VHVVVADIISGAAEIAAAAPPKRSGNGQQQGRRKIPDRQSRLRHGALPIALAAATTTAWRRALFRPPASTRSIALTLDANDGKDQHGPHAFARTGHV
jgi:hypothetical protein